MESCRARQGLTRCHIVAWKSWLNMRQNLWMWHKYRMRGIRWPWVLRQKADRCLAGFQVKCGSFPPRLMPAPLPNLLLAIAPAFGQPRGDPAIWFQIGDGVPCVRSDTLNTVWNDCQHRRPGRALRERMPAFGVTRHSSSAAVVLTSASLAVLLPPFDGCCRRCCRLFHQYHGSGSIHLGAGKAISGPFSISMTERDAACWMFPDGNAVVRGLIAWRTLSGNT